MAFRTLCDLMEANEALRDKILETIKIELINAKMKVDDPKLLPLQLYGDLAGLLKEQERPGLLAELFKDPSSSEAGSAKVAVWLGQLAERAEKKQNERDKQNNNQSRVSFVGDAKNPGEDSEDEYELAVLRLIESGLAGDDDDAEYNVDAVVAAELCDEIRTLFFNTKKPDTSGYSEAGEPEGGKTKYEVCLAIIAALSNASSEAAK